MGLTNKELLENIESIIEKKFNDKFDQLSVEINELKQTNGNLININKALIEQNQALRASLTAVGNGIAIVAAADGSDAAGCDEADADYVSPPVDVLPRIYKDVLILSDSIYRHVGSECPKANYPKLPAIYSDFELGSISILKVVCPGARCDRLFSEAALLHRTHEFGQVIIHVGSNYVPRVGDGPPYPSPSDIASEITDFLTAVEQLLRAGVTFSCILPRRDLSVVDFINSVMSLVCDFWHGLDFVWCPLFRRYRGRLNLSLLAHDGVHLSRKGAEALYYKVAEHIKYLYKY